MIKHVFSSIRCGKRTLAAALLACVPILLVAAESVDWDKRYDELCSYDQKWCGKLKESDGTWIKPKKDVVKLLATLSGEIQKAGKELGVDPRAIGGAILAENSMNVSWDDKGQDWLVKAGLGGKTAILGHKFSFGLGQLHFDVAREAENYVAKLSNRAPLGDKELEEALMTPAGAVRGVASVLKLTQDVYAKEGIDISKDPAILSTLYNLGGPARRAKETKQSGNTPRVNYFGFFVSHYLPEITKMVTPPQGQAPDPAPVAAAPAGVGPAQVQAQATATTATVDAKAALATGARASTATDVSRPARAAKPAKAMAQSRAAARSKASALPPPALKRVAQFLTQPQALVSSPPKCPLGNGKGSTQRKYSKMENFAVVSTAVQGTSYVVEAPGLDCEAEDWSLIRMSDGKRGWIKNSVLAASSESRATSDPDCGAQSDTDCLAKAQGAAGDRLKAASGPLLALKPVTAKGVEEADFKNPDWSCSVNDADNDPLSCPNCAILQGAGTGAGVGVGVGVGAMAGGTLMPMSSPSVTPLAELREPELKRLSDFFAAKKNEVIRVVGLKGPDELAGPANPYSGLMAGQLGGFAMYEGMVKTCQLRVQARIEPCKGAVDALIQAFDFPVAKVPKVSELNKFQMEAGMKLMGLQGGIVIPNSFGLFGMGGEKVRAQRYAPTPEDLKLSQGDVTKRIETCLGASAKWVIDLPNTDENRFMRTELLRVSDLLARNKPELWEMFQKEWIQVMHACEELKLLFVEGDSPQLEQCLKRETVPMNSIQFYRGDVVRSLGRADTSFVSQFVAQSLSETFPSDRMDELESRINGTYLPPAPPQPMAQVDFKPLPSYCPNRTAEFVENLVEAVPCIRAVYVPDTWLVKRLGSLKVPVLFRPFAKDDEYAVEVSKEGCK